MKLKVSTPYPDKSFLSLKGSEREVLEIKNFLLGMPHLFIEFGEVKNAGELKKMNISFPAVCAQTVEILIEDYIKNNGD